MSNILKIISIILFLVVAILTSQLYLQNKKLDLYRNIHYMDSLTNERKDRFIEKQDSLIEMLQSYKITKVIIIEKDTVR